MINIGLTHTDKFRMHGMFAGNTLEEAIKSASDHLVVCQTKTHMEYIGLIYIIPADHKEVVTVYSEVTDGEDKTKNLKTYSARVLYNNIESITGSFGADVDYEIIDQLDNGRYYFR